VCFADPRRQRLQKFFSTFPRGWPGVGLLILRIAVAVNAIAQGACVLSGSIGVSAIWPVLGLIAVVVGLVFLVGLLTPLLASILGISYLVDAALLFLNNDANKHANAFTALDLALISIALALLGPGAFSVDARLFGRLEIIIPERRRPPR
jgi:uncharacterized membrane protein YphA (DoxX/SURF4 family)